MGLNHGWRGPNIVRDGLVLYLDAGSPNSYQGSGTTWKDISKVNQNNGTLVNGPTFNSANGGSIVFDGTNDFVTLPNGLLSGTGDFTVIQWVQSDGGTGAGTTFGNYGIGNLQFGWSAQYVFLWLGNSSAYASGFTTAITMIAGRRIGTTTNYLKNGTVISTGSSGVSIGNSNATFRIGTNTATTEQYNGKIYTTMVYNKGLSNAEVLQNYNATKVRFGL